MFTERNNNSFKIKNKNNTKHGKLAWTFSINDWILYLPPVLAFGCYINGLSGEFVHDDVFAIKNNKDVLGVSAVSEVWQNDFWGKRMWDNKSHKSYRPLTVLTFRWNYMIDNGNPFYFHVVNVLLHVAVTSLLVHSCRRVFALSKKCSVMAGMLFAVHPIHTEAVSGIVGRADVLAALFFLGSFITYTTSLSSKRCDFPSVKQPWLFTLSFVLAAAAMLCKETGITVLGVCLLYDVCVVCRRDLVRNFRNIKSLVSGCVPLIRRGVAVISMVFILLAWRLWLMGGTLPTFAYNDNPASFQSRWLTRYLTYGYIWTYNCWLLLMPYNLCYDWQHDTIPLVESLTDHRNLQTACLVIVLVIATFKVTSNLQRNREGCSPDPILISLLFSVIPFLPASNVFFRVGFVLAERILYIPSMGFCIFMAVGACHLMERWKQSQTSVVASLCILLLMNAGKTWRRNEDWRSREALFRSGVNTMPHNAKVNYNYANLLKDSGRHGEAVHHYRQTIRFDRSYASAFNNLGTLLDDPQEKMALFLRTLDLNPKHVGAHVNLGTLHLKLNNVSESLRCLYRAVELNGKHAGALMGLALTLMETGAYTEAEGYLRAVFDTQPNHIQAHVHYGELLKRMGRHMDAVAHFNTAFELDQTVNAPLVFAAQSLNKLGEIGKAEDMLKRAVAISRDANALEQLAVMYYRWGRQDESLTLFEELGHMTGNSTNILVKKARVLANVGMLDKAEALLTKVLRRDRTNIEALLTQALIACYKDQHEQGIQLFNEAISYSEKARVPVTDETFVERGNCYRTAGQQTEALQDFEAALKLNPDHVTAHANAGTVYHMHNNIRKAQYHYQEALRLNPGNTIVRENMEKLDNMINRRPRAVG